MAFAPHIFRQYDIRGVVGTDLTEEVARAVGRAYGTEIRREKDRPTVVVGQDNRPSSPGLADALIDGLRTSGVDVVDVGTVPTPLVYWAEKTLGTDGGLQVTGSHNPAEYNGIKMTVGTRSLHGDRIQGLRERIGRQDYATGAGAHRSEDIVGRYIEDIRGRVKLERPVRVAVDCGNGTGALLAVSLLEAVGAEVTPLYCESDGTFPNHHPDPTVDEYLVDLIQTVQDKGLELGLGFDGDADRLGAVDDRGRVVRGDILLLLFGLDLLERKGPGQKLVFDVKCSQVLPEVFEARGGEAIMWKTGHSLMKEKMRETGAPIAGELSGHICIADNYLGFDDALFDACRLLEIVSRLPEPLSAAVDRFPRYVSTPEIRIDVTEDVKFGLVERAMEHFRARYEVIDVDGVRVQFGDGWGLLRASNTQPVLVARYEARTEERLAEIRATFEEWLRDQGVDA
ncbi:MAG: phosphomannomutase/phosphoglucomutase [Gemmatimonadota bacterium]|nr:phosphomannomutase/phosphoglucomutase [Gemmatimonadota bacterium]